ncbi:hypothetical protein [Streptomyces sp. L2]|uniref:hypothetical protein n=1 Tax=Streptomyces sp. L2 TaxID=2162665 RepID=UPI00321FAE83
MSRADVALALRRTKEFLVATNLDPKVLLGGTPTRALSLVDPHQPGMIAEFRRSLREPSEKHDPLKLVSRFDPHEVRLAGKVIKVRGHMTFKAGKPGEVLVHADYSFVYPLLHAGPHGDRQVARTIIRRDLITSLADPRKWMATKGKLALSEYGEDIANSTCGVHDGYAHPDFPDSAPTGAPPTGSAEDPYDRSRSLQDDHRDVGCGTVTRT